MVSATRARAARSSLRLMSRSATASSRRLRVTVFRVTSFSSRSTCAPRKVRRALSRATAASFSASDCRSSASSRRATTSPPAMAVPRSATHSSRPSTSAATRAWLRLITVPGYQVTGASRRLSAVATTTGAGGGPLASCAITGVARSTASNAAVRPGGGTTLGIMVRSVSVGWRSRARDSPVASRRCSPGGRCRDAGARGRRGGRSPCRCRGHGWRRGRSRRRPGARTIPGAGPRPSRQYRRSGASRARCPGWRSARSRLGWDSGCRSVAPRDPESPAGR